MADSTTISAKLKSLISLHLWCDQVEIEHTSSFVADMGADSLDCVEIIMSAEEEFDIEISQAEAEAVETFGDALNLVMSKSN